MNALSSLRNRRENRRDENGGRREPRSSVKPLYELQENKDAWGVTVQLPGVTKDSLEISAEQGLLTIRGARPWTKPESWTSLHRESADADYELVLSHDNVIDTDRIHAELRDGLLRISLPKAEAIKPRKISVG